MPSIRRTYDVRRPSPDHDVERTYRKDRLALAFRTLSRLGFDSGANGHGAVRDPEHHDRLWLSPIGVHFGAMTADDLVLASFKGEMIEGRHDVDETAFQIHSQVLTARPDITTSLHTHGVYGRAWSIGHRKLAPLHQDACAFYGSQGLLEEFGGIAYGTNEGKHIAHALADNKVCILGHHGTLAVGSTPDSAAWWLIEFERCCQIQLIAEASGMELHEVDPEVAAQVAIDIGSDDIGWLQYQPLGHKTLGL